MKRIVLSSLLAVMSFLYIFESSGAAVLEHAALSSALVSSKKTLNDNKTKVEDSLLALLQKLDLFDQHINAIIVDYSQQKILILSSNGGGGHISTNQALTHYLKPNYSVSSANIFNDVISNLDLINTLTRKKVCGEQFYNYCIAGKHFRLINAIHTLGKKYFRDRTTQVTALVQEFLQKEKPDLIISIIPFVNGAIIKASKNLGIPVILLPTDLSTDTFIHDIDNPDYDKFSIALIFGDPSIKDILKSAHISQKQIQVTGLPLRPEFFAPKDIDAIKAEFSIKKNKPVILLLMGAVGSNALLTFAQQLTKIAIPCHVVICVGKSVEMIEQIKKLDFPKYVSYTIVEFTQKIADLMAVADLFITKSGTISVCEAIYLNLPMLVDATSGVLEWEKFNHNFIKEHGFGDVIHKPVDILTLVHRLLMNPALLQFMKNNLKQYQKKDGNIQLQQLVRQQLHEKIERS